jgi:phage terminase large subunit GpA-like protein
MIDATPRLRAKISENARDKSNSASLKEFPGGVLAIAGANSAAELKSMPVRYLFEDEVDEYPDDVDGQGPADELAEKRTDTFSRKKIYRTSTPTEKGARRSGGTSSARTCAGASCRARTARPSRCCAGTSSAGKRARSGSWSTPTARSRSRRGHRRREAARHRRAARRLVRVRALPRAKIDEHHKTWMLERGRWIAEHPEGRHAGFHLPSYYSPLGWFSWRQVVQDRLEADKDPTGHLLKIWTNTVAGEPLRQRASRSRPLARRSAPSRTSSAPCRWAACCSPPSVDVQANRLEVKVKAWGRGEESWLVAYEVIFGDTETRRRGNALDEYLQRKFPHECGATLRILATAVDAGYRTQTVYDWCRRRAHRHIFPVRGQSQAGKRSSAGRPSRTSTTAARRSSAASKLWPIGTDTAKSKIYARLKITEPGPGCMHFPLGLPDEYYKGSSPPSAWCRATTAASSPALGEGRRRAQRGARPRGVRLRAGIYARRHALQLGPDRGGAARDRRRPLRQRRRKTKGRQPRGNAAGRNDRARRGAAAVQTSAPAPRRRGRSNWVTGFKR